MKSNNELIQELIDELCFDGVVTVNNDMMFFALLNEFVKEIKENGN